MWEVEPWGQEASTVQLAVIATILANTNAKKGSKKFKPKDFMPKAPEGADYGRLSPDQIKKRFEAIAEKFEEKERAAARGRGGRKR